jgi:hypothetical protein
MPDLYSALDVVSRELVGFVPAVTRDSTADRAALNQSVRSFVAPASSAGNITAAVTPPDDGDQTIGNVVLSITKARRVPFRWNGEETLSMNSGGPGAARIRQDQMAQAIRTLVNEIEVDLAGLHVSASRAYGTATTDPFASSLADPAQVRAILSDNGAPLSDLQMVISTSAGAAMRTLAQLTKANEAADTSMLRQGVLLDIHGFAIRESGQIARPALGTLAGSPSTAAGAGLTVGQTVLVLTNAAGTGKPVAGDIITIANDPNKYVVESFVIPGANPATGDTITIAAPGLRVAQASGTARVITVVAISSRNMAFSRNAIALATRLPALPDGGDMAVDRTTITDPRSGLSFEVAMYAQYRQMQYEVSAAWGVKMIKPRHAAILLGA